MKSKILIETGRTGRIGTVYVCDGDTPGTEVVTFRYSDDPLEVWFSDGQTVHKFLLQVALGNEHYREIAQS